MADEERGKRKRGRHRPRGNAHRRPIEPQQEDGAPAEEQEAPEVISVSEVPEETGTRHRFTFGRGDKKPAGASKEKSRSGERHSGGVSEGSVSPMDFWRSGTAKPHRPVQVVSPKGPRFLRRITGMYLPPWAPVFGIIVVVFGILGLLFVLRSATGSPRIGEHWHATYQFFACGEKQPNARQWEAGVHTHADGILHIHPFQTFEEGSGARLIKWFEYGGGKLTNSEINIPGSSKTYKN